MATVDKAPRRLSFTQYLSPSHHHDRIVRKRAQSLNAQAERKNSILRNGVDGGGGALSAPEPLSPSPSVLQSSSTGSQNRSKPRPYHERQVQFAEPHRPVHKPGHISFASRRARKHTNEYVATTNRKIGRPSRVTGELYFVEEPTPIYPYRSTCFSPPPTPLGPYDDESDTETPIGCFSLFPRRRAGSHDSDHESDEQDQSFNSSLPPPPISVARSQPVDPLLYTTLSEKLTAHWGVFMLNMRFRMFRVQDRVKNGVARVGAMVRRMKTGRSSSV